MPFCETRDGVKLFYEDMGQGSPIVFIHGWPASHNMFEYQYTALAPSGYRCIGYDRRGFGMSDRPFDGYDYNTFADDLSDLLEHLDVNDVTLVGFSMGGGEIARYMSRYQGKRVSKVAFVGAVTPYLLKDDTNEDGVDREVFDEMYENFLNDRPNALAAFGKQFFGVNLVNHPVSSEFLQAMMVECMQASPKATLDCIRAFSETDFRPDLPSIQVPTLIIHGTSDAIVPIDVSARKTAGWIPQAEYIEYDGEPHGLYYTSRDQFNQDLARFVGETSQVARPVREPESGTPAW